jgi:hypothetical protein
MTPADGPAGPGGLEGHAGRGWTRPAGQSAGVGHSKLAWDAPLLRAAWPPAMPVAVPHPLLTIPEESRTCPAEASGA